MHRSSEFHRAQQTPCRPCPSARPAGPGRFRQPFLRLETNIETSVTVRICRQTPLMVGRHRGTATTSLGNIGNAANSPMNRTWPSMHRAKERALSFLSLFRRQCQAAATAGKIKRINGLPGFPEKRSERDHVCRSAGQILWERIPGVEGRGSSGKCEKCDTPGGSHCLRCARRRAGRKAFRALWKLRRILLRGLATLAIATIVQVRERGHLRSIESPWRQQCPKPLFRACSVDAASAA
jgi:hypothetical protein